MKSVNLETGEIVKQSYQNNTDDKVDVIVSLGPGERLSERYSKMPVGEPKNLSNRDDFCLVFQANTTFKISRLNDAERSLWMMLIGYLDWDCYVKKDGKFINKGMVAGIMGWNRKKAYAALQTLFQEQIIAYTGMVGVDHYIMVNPLYIHRGTTAEVEEKKKMFLQKYNESMK